MTPPGYNVGSRHIEEWLERTQPPFCEMPQGSDECTCEDMAAWERARFEMFSRQQAYRDGYDAAIRAVRKLLDERFTTP